MSGQLPTVLLIALVLGLDAFSLALVMGLRGSSRRYEYKFALSVAAFHILMPLLGLGLGYTAGKILGLWASWAGAAVLAYVGVSFIREGYEEVKKTSISFSEALAQLGPNTAEAHPRERGILLLTASVSMDALAIGFTLGTVRVPLLLTVLIMGVVAGFMTLIGFRSGKILGSLAGRYAQMAGGAVLVMLAAKIVLL
jgi:putative Mn2+ efflux pump MntP